jgi:hypothetical protein
MSGNISRRAAAVTASPRSVPALMYAIAAGGEKDLHLSAQEVGESRCPAAIGRGQLIIMPRHAPSFAA